MSEGLAQNKEQRYLPPYRILEAGSVPALEQQINEVALQGYRLLPHTVHVYSGEFFQVAIATMYIPGLGWGENESVPRYRSPNPGNKRHHSGGAP